jgi:ABC-2 type transport system permease protein
VNGLIDMYVQQFRTSLATMLQYRASLVIWLISQVLEPLIYLIVWTVVSKGQGGSVGGFTASGFAAYFILLMLVNHVTYTWIMYEYEYRVRHGSLSFSLLRPVHPIHADIADNVSSKAVSFPAMLLAAVGLALIFKPDFHFAPWAVLAALPAIALAFILRFFVEWCLALAAFWITRVSALNQTYFVAMLFLSGQIAPLALMPGWVQTVASISPFRWMISFPLELLMGQLSAAAAVRGFGVQLIWVFLAWAVMRVVWRAGVRAYSAVGG